MRKSQAPRAADSATRTREPAIASVSCYRPVVAPSQWSPERLDALNRLTTVARLLSTAVHETSNSLQIISGNAEMLGAQASDPDRVRTRAESIKSHADRAGARLRTLVALASATPAARRTADVRQLAEQALDLRRYSLGRAQVAVSVRAEGAALASVDELAVVRILANLSLNAEQAMADRPGRALAIGITPAGSRVRVVVSDTGPGVPADRVATLFAPFDDGAQSGCGLAVSRWLAEQQGGTLTFDGTHAPGAAFVLELAAATGRPA